MDVMNLPVFSVVTDSRPYMTVPPQDIALSGNFQSLRPTIAHVGIAQFPSRMLQSGLLSADTKSNIIIQASS